MGSQKQTLVPLFVEKFKFCENLGKFQRSLSLDLRQR